MVSLLYFGLFFVFMAFGQELQYHISIGTAGLSAGKALGCTLGTCKGYVQ